MHLYSFVMENPNGIDWSVEFAHERKFDDEEFRGFCEEALVAFCKRDARKGAVGVGRGIFGSEAARAFVRSFLSSRLFVPLEHASVYGFDPWSGPGLVASAELRGMVLDDKP